MKTIIVSAVVFVLTTGVVLAGNAEYVQKFMSQNLTDPIFTQKDISAFKFMDEGNTCYVVESLKGISISCVK